MLVCALSSRALWLYGARAPQHTHYIELATWTLCALRRVGALRGVSHHAASLCLLGASLIDVACSWQNWQTTLCPRDISDYLVCLEEADSSAGRASRTAPSGVKVQEVADVSASRASLLVCALLSRAFWLYKTRAPQYTHYIELASWTLCALRRIGALRGVSHHAASLEESATYHPVITATLNLPHGRCA